MQEQSVHRMFEEAEPSTPHESETGLPASGRRLPLTLRVNGQIHAINVDPRRTLLDALRHDCGLTGAKKVCDMGNCGACTVLLDGQAVYGCLVLAAECEERDIATVEGLGSDAILDALQQAFIEKDAFQCGYCTPGQIMSLKALLERDPSPSDADIAEAVAGNLCRCGAYRHILEAARAAVDTISNSQQERKGA